jgi:16S rRNA (uracil1498-N3)-methyltransferase
MRITRVFLTQPLRVDETIELPAASCEHLLRVLRLSEGASLVLCNGDGIDYRATLTGVGKRGASARVVDAAPNHSESPLRIVLVQALARGEKMDWIVQKATELGVAAIQPVVTERTEVHLDAERAARRLAHWEGIAASACEQSGRSRTPEISQPQSLSAWLGSMEPGTLRLALDPQGRSLSHVLEESADTPAPPIHLVVGPEGGLSERDHAQLQAARFAGFRLGPRILRTETAGLVALSVLQSTFGDLR